MLRYWALSRLCKMFLLSLLCAATLSKYKWWQEIWSFKTVNLYWSVSLVCETRYCVYIYHVSVFLKCTKISERTQFTNSTNLKPYKSKANLLQDLEVESDAYGNVFFISKTHLKEVRLAYTSWRSAIRSWSLFGASKPALIFKDSPQIVCKHFGPSKYDGGNFVYVLTW